MPLPGPCTSLEPSQTHVDEVHHCVACAELDEVEWSETSQSGQTAVNMCSGPTG
jgi:hypothetical protein